MFEAVAKLFGIEDYEPTLIYGETIPPHFSSEEKASHIDQLKLLEGEALNEALRDYAKQKETLEQLFELMIAQRSESWVDVLLQRVQDLPERTYATWSSQLHRYASMKDQKTMRNVQKFHPFLSLLAEYCALRIAFPKMETGTHYTLHFLTNVERVFVEGAKKQDVSVETISAQLAAACIAEKNSHRGISNANLLYLWRRSKIFTTVDHQKFIGDLKVAVSDFRKRESKLKSFALFLGDRQPGQVFIGEQTKQVESSATPH